MIECVKRKVVCVQTLEATEDRQNEYFSIENSYKWQQKNIRHHFLPTHIRLQIR